MNRTSPGAMRADVSRPAYFSATGASPFADTSVALAPSITPRSPMAPSVWFWPSLSSSG